MRTSRRVAFALALLLASCEVVSPAGQSAPVPPNPTSADVAGGSVPVGSASYPIPAGSIFASTTGDDANPGTQASPVRTIERAVALAPANGAVVIRGGVYRESLTWSEPLTVQNFPGEAVWLDGSVPVTGWIRDPLGWRRDGWTIRFDSSPTYTQGAPDNTDEHWRFVSEEHPMAAHPDQLFIDGEPQQQVEARTHLTPGTFYLDEATSRLYLGSDPGGHTVEASTLVKALSVRGHGSTIRGIGIRRYSPSVFHLGAVTLEAPGARLENVVVQDVATTGVSVLNTDSVLAGVTVSGSGMLGIHARFADRIIFSRVFSTRNNDELFNLAPVSGGAKLTQVRGVTVRNSNFSGNYGHGFWADESVYDTVVRQSGFNGNAGTGLFFEISAKAVVGDSRFADNMQDGIKVNNTSNVEIWNNTFVGNGRSVNLVQDARRNTDRDDPAADPRVRFPDPEMPWTLGPVNMHNNVIASPNASADCLLCVEDYSSTATGEEMEISADSNVYHRANAASPAWLAIWSRGSASSNPHVVTTIEALREITGQERNGREYLGASIIDAELSLVSSVSQETSSIAQPLPADLAAKLGRPAGARALGAW